MVAAWSFATWWGDSRLLLSDDGLYATEGFAEGVHYPGRWSVFDALASPTGVRLLIVVAVLSCAALFVRPTKVIGVASLVAVFVCAASLNARAPFAISSAEMYLVVLLFWAVLGSILGWSTHSIRALRIQVVLVYLMPLLIRFLHGGDTWIDGSALRNVVDNADARRGPLGPLVRHLPDAVLSAATWGTLLIECTVVVLLLGMTVFSDRIPRSFRRGVISLAITLHVCIAVVCGLWFFSTVAIVGLLAATGLEFDDAADPRRGAVSWAMIACVVVWSFLSISSSPAVAAGEQKNLAALAVRGSGITQVWAVFSPNPPRMQRWVEIIDDNATVIIDSRRASNRLRKLAQNVRSHPDGLLARSWLGALCRSGSVSLGLVSADPRVRTEALRADCARQP